MGDLHLPVDLCKSLADRRENFKPEVEFTYPRLTWQHYRAGMPAELRPLRRPLP